MSTPTDSVPVAVTTEGNVAVIEMQSPPANYFDLAVLQRIAEAGRELADAGTRAIVLASQGRHFCAGANFGSGGLGPDREGVVREIYAAAVEIFQIPVPVVAAVQGSAVGGGLGLACAADFRAVTPSTRMHANFSALGFHQGFGLSVSLPRIVGDQAASRILLSSERLNGAQAFQIGLADALVEDGADANSSVRAGAIDFANRIAAMAPLAVRSIRSTLRADLADRIAAILEHEITEQVELWQTEDCDEGIAANLERRAAVFHGR